MTNQQIIKKLLPHLLKAIEELPSISFEKKDYYGHPYYKTNFDEINIIYTDYDDRILIEAYILFNKGKYSHATLFTYIMKNNYEILTTSNGAMFGYAKELKGLGNGYYADVSINGKILKSELD